jgi:ketosteroid isomerase-like protein
MVNDNEAAVVGRRWLCAGLGAAIVVALSGADGRAPVEGEAGMTASQSEAERLRAQNQAIVQRYADAWARGDLPAIVESYHPDFTLHYFGRSSLAGDHVGKAAALKTLAEVSRRTNRKLLGIVAVMSSPERSAIIAREAFEREGALATFERVFVFTTKDGRLHECWVYDADQAAVDQFLR